MIQRARTNYDPARRPRPFLAAHQDNPARDEIELERLERFARMLDTAFRVPIVGLRFGLDAILDLIPGIGDAIGAILSLYIFQAARRFGVPRVTLTRIALNIGIDYIGGLLPILGAVFDAYWKANFWNVALIRRHVESAPAEQRRARRGDWLFVLATITIALLLIAGTMVLTVWLIHLVLQLFK
jgi:Domain of unknown function (DUF4112)